MNLEHAKEKLIIAQRNLIYTYTNPPKWWSFESRIFKNDIDEYKKEIIGLEAIIDNFKELR